MISRKSSDMGIETRRLAQAKKKNSPPILSHEFIIQNHGDITSCVIMVIFVGFMFPATHKLASVFVVPQYNETVDVRGPNGDIFYSYEGYRVGLSDIFTVLFYAVGCITMHAIIQEYILDKIQRRVHLSKTKQTKFSESGQLLVFAAYSVGHAVYAMQEFITDYSDIKRIWTGYPDEHKFLSLRGKIFFLVQLAYWLHLVPEFYLQKLKREEWRARIVPITIHFAAIAAAYSMNFHRFALVVLSAEYALATIFHIARPAHFLENKGIASMAFRTWNVLFVVVRVAVAVLSVTVFWHGLRQSETPFVDVAAGNFNTSYVRLNCLICMLLLQLFQLWNFLSFHIGRWRESRSRKQKKTTATTPSQGKAKAKKAPSSEEETTETDSRQSPKQTAAQKKKN